MIRVAPTSKRVRTFLGGVPVADSTEVKLVWEKPYYPTYYFPRSGVSTSALEPSGETKRSTSRGDARLFDVVIDGKRSENAAYDYPEPKMVELADHVAFRWSSMDNWFEEDEEVFVHARDPYKRVDILSSSRHVQVSIDGITVAESRAPRLLFETDLPVRYYLPKVDVRMDLMIPSDLHTDCPYKGTASYWSVQTGDSLHQDIAWSYPSPVAESAKVAGLVCFYNEKVDMTVDDVRLERPNTVFS